MIKHYLLTASRNFWRNKVFSAINVLGLAVGISATIVIYLMVNYDFSYEQFQKNKHRIYRVVSEMRYAGDVINNAGVPYPVPEAARREIPGIGQCAAFEITYPKVTIPTGANPPVFRLQGNTIFADGHYFSLFPYYHWLAGSPNTALDKRLSTVLTKSRAEIYFPGLTPDKIIGRHILYNDTLDATVTGIVSDLDQNTSFRFQEFISHPTIYRPLADANDWNSVNGNSQCFIELKPGTNPAAVERRLAQLRKKYAGKPDNDLTTTHRLQPLTEMHFDTRYDAFGAPPAHKPTLYGLMWVAVFLLLLASINFINLTTAQAAHRAKEIGIRKTLGSSVAQLIRQFLGETFLLTALSLVLALVLTPWLLQLFSTWLPKDLRFRPFHDPGIFLFLLALLIVVTLLAGLYPALVLSRYRPVLVLKNQLVTGSTETRNAWLRKTLTIFQFTIAQIFVIATIIVGRQIHYSINSDLGFRKDAILVVNAPWTFGEKDDRRFVLLDKIRQMPGIEMASTGSSAPTDGGSMTNTLVYKDGKKEIPVNLQVKFGDSNYIKLYKLKLLAGRAPATADTSKEFVINETCRQLLGFKTPGEALGKNLGETPIVGVIADFHHTTLHSPILPLALSSSRVFEFSIGIALRPQIPGTPTWSATIARIGDEYKRLFPETSYNYAFVDESIARLYTTDQNIARLLTWATGLTIFISCLGLTGLVIFTTNSRIKEIGIRKVLGASVTAIATLLSKDFVKLLVISFLIATPVAAWAMHKWLENFAYRQPVSWWIFPLAGIGMIAVALLTMSIRTIRTALANPVTALRSE